MGKGRQSAVRLPEYHQFLEIDGEHPHKRDIPDGHVAYAARRLRGSEIVFFNYALAREMGLLPAGHPDRMNARLRRRILDAFSLRIINEYDLERNTRFPRRDLLPNTYMATRYLALQHPGRTGKTSGDGRSVWNGTSGDDRATWDVSSCGTGVTRLCPATAERNEFFRTGNWKADYGCGTATVQEGLIAALMSETFHGNGIATERTLAVIELADGFAINVRAGRNLLRPSHFFVYLKQNNLRSLKAAIDAFIARQTQNGDFPDSPAGPARYAQLAETMALTFGRVAATFEREYIFCWLDWDGDNILADGGIIDYGSVRQFGLFHREYRFDDGPRWSTTIGDQRRKARHIVQCFAQIRDFLIQGRRSSLASFAHDPLLRTFDLEFARTKDRLLLRDVGFDAPAVERLLGGAVAELREFARAHAYFERARAARGPHRVADGISWNAIYCVRDLLRELPVSMLQGRTPLSAREFLDLALSDYASRRDRRLTAHRARQAAAFQRSYLKLIETAATLTQRSAPLVLGDVAARSAILNRPDRLTGDGVVHAADRLVRSRKRLACDGVYEIVTRFAEYQTRVPERRAPDCSRSPEGVSGSDRVLQRIIDVVADFRYGL